jgi:hypothetical protein
VFVATITGRHRRDESPSLTCVQRRPSLGLRMMVIRRALLVTSLVSSLACSSVIVTGRPQDLDQATKIASLPGKQETEVRYGAARGQAVRRGVVSPFDSHAFLVTTPAGESGSIPFSTTQSMSFRDRNKGGRNGFIMGALVGGLLGAVSVSALSASARESDFQSKEDSTNLKEIGVGFLVGGLVFGMIGGVLGAASGQRTTIEFH